MDAQSLTKIEYASAAGRFAGGGGDRWLVALLLTLGAYVISYVVLRAFIEPAANLAFFVYPGSAAVDECCYYGFWPLYKMDRFLTGRKHNLDRTPFVMPEGDAGL